MIALIVKKNQQTLAVLESIVGGNMTFAKGYDASFADWLQKELGKGIGVGVEAHDLAERKFSLGKVVMPKEDVTMDMLRDFLRHSGYEVMTRDLGVEAKIKEIVDLLPDDDTNKKEILNKIPEMSHLAKTALLERLEDTEKEEEPQNDQ